MLLCSPQDVDSEMKIVEAINIHFKAYDELKNRLNLQIDWVTSRDDDFLPLHAQPEMPRLNYSREETQHQERRRRPFEAVLSIRSIVL